MMPRPAFHHRLAVFLGALVLTCPASAAAQLPNEVVVTKIGESFEQVRRQSSLPIAPADERSITLEGAFRFADPRHGFAAPPWSLLRLSVPGGDVRSVTITPQTIALPIAEAIALAIDWQNTLRQAGWRQALPDEHPPVEDTPEVRGKIDRNLWRPTFWTAGEGYELWIHVNRWISDAMMARNWPTVNRYVVELQLGSRRADIVPIPVGAVPPGIDHPGTVVMRDAWNGSVQTIDVSDLHSYPLHVCFDRDGGPPEYLPEDWCVPIMEVERHAVDAHGNPISADEAVSVTTTQYGPGRTLLRGPIPVGAPAAGPSLELYPSPSAPMSD